MTSTKVGMDHPVSLLCSGVTLYLIQLLVQRAFQEVLRCICFPLTLVVSAVITFPATAHSLGMECTSTPIPHMLIFGVVVPQNAHHLCVDLWILHFIGSDDGTVMVYLCSQNEIVGQTTTPLMVVLPSTKASDLSYIWVLCFVFVDEGIAEVLYLDRVVKFLFVRPADVVGTQHYLAAGISEDFIE